MDDREKRMKNRNTPPTQETEQESVAWNALPWKKLEQHVYSIQKRIYQASQRDEKRKVEKLQKLLMKSSAARLLAVRRVTQENQGKKTAGIDGVKSVKPNERMVLAERIHPKNWKDLPARPVRRVWIPKPGKSGEQRPLGIPVMVERAQQTLVKMALEPAWEALFEPNSYGFRPGRSCQDAIGAVFLDICQKPKYVFDADVKGAFDAINQTALLEKLQTYPQIRRAIKGWLKAGVLEGKEFSPTERGTPQGGALSPLLMNIALHGMETAITEGTKKSGKPMLIRYADDFVIFHAKEEELKKAAERATQWLQEMGLQVHPGKTRITHTLDPYEGKVGFDFLGFTIRQYHVGKTHTGKSVRGKPLGHKTLITPSRAARKRQARKQKELLRELTSAPQEVVIKTLNPIIRGWTSYYKGCVCSRAFLACEYTTFRQVMRWERRRHPKKSRRWIKARYTIKAKGSIRFGMYLKDKEGKEISLFLKKYTDTQHQRHIKVKGTASPYDGRLLYWAQRLKNHPLMRHEMAQLLASQKGQCPKCHLYFQDEEALKIDHILPMALGGKDERSNKWVYHHHCYDEKTAEDKASIAKHKAAGVTHN
jgi:RNA-directed DNA polymerase